MRNLYVRPEGGPRIFLPFFKSDAIINGKPPGAPGAKADERMRFMDSHHPWAMATILFWSMAFVLTRLSLQHFTAFPLGFLRYFAASVVLIAVLWLKRVPLPRRADWKWFLLSGATGFFLYMIAFNKGCETVSSATGSVVLATVPVLTALMARALHGEMLRPHQWAAMAVEFSGVALLMLMDGVFSVNAGLLYLLAAVVLLSAYNLLQRRLTKTYSGLQASAYSVLAGTLMLAVFAPQGAAQAVTAPPRLLMYVAILGVFTSAFAYVAWANAFKRAEKASSVSNYMFLSPLLASALGFLMANEVPDRGTLLGGGVILVGVLLFNYGAAFGRRAAALAASAPLDARDRITTPAAIIPATGGTKDAEPGIDLRAAHVRGASGGQTQSAPQAASARGRFGGSSE